MSSTTFILDGFASIPRLLTIKPKKFSADTPKVHLLGLTSCYSFSGPGTTQLGGLRGAQIEQHVQRR